MKYITIPTSNDYSVWYDKNYYVDKTWELRKLEWTLERWSAIFFARPRRWGKSLFFSMTNYFFNKKLYKKEYFEWKDIEKSEILAKKAGKYYVMSLDLKPIYDKDTNSLNWDQLWLSIYEQLPEKYLENIFWDKRNIFEKIFWLKRKKIFQKKQEEINYLKSKYTLWSFIKSFVEDYSQEEEILLLIDEYDKPVNDCLKFKKNELNCKKQILEELKDKLYRYLKDIPCIIMITWINKLSMSSFFSDFNNLSDYSYLVSLWYKEKEVKQLFKNLEISYTEEVKKWYNWYNFDAGEEFNPWAVNEYFKRQKFASYWSKTWTAPDYFRYLMSDILKVKSFEDFLKLLEKQDYTDEVIALETINEMNVSIILHYFYYSGLLTITETNKFAIPNNDVIFSYKNLIFSESETQTYVKLRNIATDAVEKLEEDTNYLKEFIKYLLNEKYVNHDKNDLKKLWEQVITSDIALILRTFIRIDLRREVNLLKWRTDIEYINTENGKRIVWEIKVFKEEKEFENKKEEWLIQLKKYIDSGRYQDGYLILINLNKGDCEVMKY